MYLHSKNDLVKSKNFVGWTIKYGQPNIWLIQAKVLNLGKKLLMEKNGRRKK